MCCRREDFSRGNSFVSENRENPIVLFGGLRFFVGKRFFLFGCRSQFLHQMAFSVTMHFGFFLVDTKDFGDVIVVEDVFGHRENRPREYRQANQDYEFFHDSKVTLRFAVFKGKFEI